MKASAVHSLKELKESGLIPEISAGLKEVAAQFSIAITPAMVTLIDAGNPNDPVSAQFVPSEKELYVSRSELQDPIGDESHSPVEGIIHRYPDRVLFKLLHICPVYCRFCFRREQVGKEKHLLSQAATDEAIAYIKEHKEIWEVILSGGDPLLLSDRRLGEVMEKLRAIEHVKVLRIHTRIPVVEPERVTAKLVELLKGDKPLYILLHCNHPRELTQGARIACARLVDAGIPLLSQSVLLKGVNDEAPVLAELMRSFVECRIKPHYLHHPDLARGTGHFRLSVKRGQELMRSLRGHLSGLCQPTYILDIPQGYGKIPIGPIYAHQCEQGWEVEDYRGLKHLYTTDEDGA